MVRLIWSSALFSSLLQIATANPLNLKRWDDLETKHAWTETPRNWELVGPAQRDQSMQMRIGLKQDRIDELIDHLYQVSDPSHSRYAQKNSLRSILLLTPKKIWRSLVQVRSGCPRRTSSLVGGDGRLLVSPLRCYPWFSHLEWRLGYYDCDR
jgi:hypothetical protein